MIRDWADDLAARRLRAMPACTVRKCDGHVVTLAAGQPLKDGWYVVDASGAIDHEATRARIIADQGTESSHGTHTVTRGDLVDSREAMFSELVTRHGIEFEVSTRNPIANYFATGAFLKQKDPERK